MRDVPKLWDAWRSGVYVGETKPSTRVTVEKGWTLQPTGPVVGSWTRGPARWYQRADRVKQLETELPNVLSVNSNRSIDSDAGTCDIVVQNTLTPEYGQLESPAGQFGDLGHFTWDHGSAQDARARWGHVQNPWSDVLVPNALLRTYVGFGGEDDPIDVAVAQGNLVLYGVWLIDEIAVSTEGTVSITCRDMAKLLIDQQLFPPLVPASLYPLSYQRYTTSNVAIPSGAFPASQEYDCQYWASSTDQVYGEWNTHATGHPGTDAFDSSIDPDWRISGEWPVHQRSYWLSEPKGGPYDTVWIEFFVNGGDVAIINQLYYHAWKGVMEGRGSMRVMVSIQENGYWAAPETSDGGVTPEGLPYVCTFVPGQEPAPGVGTNIFDLPRDYNATYVRLTVTDLKWADDFPYQYQDPDFHGGGWRGGARKIYARFDGNKLGQVQYTVHAVAAHTGPEGYWQIRCNGQAYAFGDARTYPINSPKNTPRASIVKMVSARTNQGYWYADLTGRVLTAGSAQWFGDLENAQVRDIVGLAVSSTQNGYYLLHADGKIDVFGSVADYGDSVHGGTMPYGAPNTATCIACHPTGLGYWVLWTDGTITAHGPDAVHHGNCTDRTGFLLGEWTCSLQPTKSGAGYWVLSTVGHVQVRGNAEFFGHAQIGSGYDSAGKWHLGVTWDLITSSQAQQKGYAIVTADGNLWICGDPTGFNYGSVGAGNAQQRTDGNYKDYSDIIKDLCLWSGFYLQNDNQPTNQFPAVYGNIETTGAWAEAPLPPEMFDKRPVMEAISELKEVVGYSVWIDPEGGFRWESPNYWTLGNFLINGAPYPHMPEIDETVQLVGHNVTFTANDARSRLIIATQDPYPSLPGTNPPTGVVQTEIVPKTAADLRGLLVPAMWTNGKFLLPEEQKVMADLVDMRMWFNRRKGSVTCVANPLLDINDQVRVIERQTGDVYIHYIRGISFSHDLQSGSFQMTLETHWLGGSLWGKTSTFRSGAARPAADGYWLATLGGSEKNAKAGVYGHGQAPVVDSNEADSHLETIVALRSTHTGAGYYTIDESGKVLTYGTATNYGSVYRGMKNPNDQRRNGDVVDMALTPSGNGYWILQKNGTITGFGDAANLGNGTPAGNLPSGTEVYSIALESHPVTPGYWILHTDGTVQTFGLTPHGNATRAGFTTADYATRLRRTTSGAGYWIISAGGITQAFGNATLRALTSSPPAADQPVYGYVWDLLVAPDGSYAHVRADGELVGYSFPVDRPTSPAPRQASWALLAPQDYATLTDRSAAFPVSTDVMTFLAGTTSPSANNAVTNNFAAPSPDAIQGVP